MLKGLFGKRQNQEKLIWTKLQGASAGALAGTESVLGVAILYENPRNIALPEKHKLAEIIAGQYRGPDWIPQGLSIDEQTPVAARELVQGKEISAHAGLDTAKSNEILAGMLSTLVGKTRVENISAMAFSGDSPALGQTFFAVLTK